MVNIFYMAAARSRKTYAAAPPPPPPDGLTPSVVLAYADASGVVQSTTVVNGVTSITGVAPFIVHLDASGSRSDIAGGDTAPGAWHNIGYLMHYGEGLGGTWEHSTLSRDYDMGPPMFGRVFTVPGSRLVRLRCRHADGEATIQFTVVVQSPPTPTHIPVSAGSWPTWVSGTHYTLEAGGDYSSWGDIVTSGLDNILISKAGSGADPIISGFRPDSRQYVNVANAKRAANVRLLDIDCAAYYHGVVGHDFCGVVNGRVRQIQGAAEEYFFDEGYGTGRTVNELNNIRYTQGSTLWNTGELNANSGDDYVYFVTGVRAIVQGVRMNKNNAVGGAHVLRGTHFKSVFRHNNLMCAGTTTSLIKLGGFESPYTDIPADWTAHNLRVGDASNGQRYPYPVQQTVFADTLLGGSGQTLPNLTFSAAPQNNDSGFPREGADMVAFENMRYFTNAPVSQFNDASSLGGRNLSVRNVRYASSGYPSVSTGASPNRIPIGWEGPYVVENANTRPVPTPF